MCGVPTSLLVDLDGGLVVFDSNDFTNEVLIADTDLEMSTAVPALMAHRTYELVHGTSDHVLGDDDRSGRVSIRLGRGRAVTYPEME